MKGLLSIFLVIAVLSFSCEKEKVDRSKLVETELQRRLIEYEKIRLGKCKEQFMEEINLEVDSLMFFLVQRMKGNSDLMPERPPRPGRLVDTILLEALPRDN